MVDRPASLVSPNSKQSFIMTLPQVLFPAAALAFIKSAGAIPVVHDPSTTLSSAATTTAFVVLDANVTSHGPFSGTAETTGALTAATILGASITAQPAPPSATTYVANGELNNPQPAPYVPGGGRDTNGTAPVYRPMSDFDYQSLALALYQEWIELDLFHYGLATFSEEDFLSIGLSAEDRYLLQFMAEQEVGHATLITNMLGPEAPVQCTYNYPVSDLQEYIDFSQKLTRFGESGVYGFLNHLDSGATGQLLLQSISTEARQQMIFRQFEGLFPMPVWFEVGIPQSWAWTLLAPYISSCPTNQTRLVWQNLPALHVLNQPNPARINGSNVFNETTGGYTNTLNTTDIEKSASCINATVGEDCSAAITHNRTQPLSYPGRQVFLQWDEPGKLLGPNNSYITTTSAVGGPRYCLWVNQLNATYTLLEDVHNNTAYTFQPNTTTFEGDPMVNGTSFIAITDTDLYVTPYNLSMVNPHVYALALYQAG